MRAVKSATGAIRAAVAEDITGEDKLAKLKEKLSANRILGSAWKSYAADLRPNERAPGGYVNLVDPHTWFVLDRPPGRGYEKWAVTLAGVALTVALFFTFVGLSAALLQVGDAGSDTNRLRLAITEILQISSANFITSMAGILA